MSTAGLPWTGHIKRGFATWVGQKLGVSAKVVSAVLSGTKTSDRIAAYVCGSLGLPYVKPSPSPKASDDAPPPDSARATPAAARDRGV